MYRWRPRENHMLETREWKLPHLTNYKEYNEQRTTFMHYRISM